MGMACAICLSIAVWISFSRENIPQPPDSIDWDYWKQYHSLEGIRGDHTIRDVSLGDCQDLHDRDIEPIGTLPNLRSLDLAHSQVTDEGFGKLPYNDRLEEIHLAGTATGDASLEWISLQFPKLRMLSVAKGITETGRNRSHPGQQ